MGITAEFRRVQVFTGEIEPNELYKLIRKADTLSKFTVEEMKILIAEMHAEINNREQGVKDV